MIKQLINGELIIFSSSGAYPNVEKLNITNNIKNKIILIFFIAQIFIFLKIIFSF